MRQLKTQKSKNPNKNRGFVIMKKFVNREVMKLY